MSRIVRPLLGCGLLIGLAGIPAQAQVIIDLTTTGASATGTGQIGGGFVASQTFVGAAGSGGINAFLRVQSNGGEQGYNTSAGLPFDSKNIPGGLAQLLLSDVPLVDIGGVIYREFVLDINQNGGGNISLNQLQIFQSAADPGTGGTATAATASTDPVLSFSGGSITEIFRLNNATQSASSYEILGATGSGSGTIDVAFYVRDSSFTQTPSSVITLFTQFGTPNGSLGADGGFEEWAVRVGVAPPAAVPEPGPIALSAVGLGLFGASALARRRARNRGVVASA